MYDYATIASVLEEDVHCHAWIEPRYLAGMGESENVFGTLVDDFGWDHTNERHRGEWATSPCGVAVVRLLPREHEDPWDWTIDVDGHRGHGQWRATFEHEAPEESSPRSPLPWPADWPRPTHDRSPDRSANLSPQPGGTWAPSTSAPSG